MTIKTKYEPKPIPMRRFDWEAWVDDEDGPIGYGATKDEAIADLKIILSLKKQTAYMKKIMIGVLITAIILGSVFISWWIMALSFVAFIGWTIFRIRKDINDDSTDEHYKDPRDESMC